MDVVVGEYRLYDVIPIVSQVTSDIDELIHRAERKLTEAATAMHYLYKAHPTGPLGAMVSKSKTRLIDSIDDLRSQLW